jgi:hypothetical protein
MDKEQLENLINELLENPDKINELDDETVKKVSEKINIYGKVDFVPKNNYCCLSITNLKDDYLKKMSMLSLVGFVYKMLDEYQAVEEEEKKPIKEFLDSLFEFNPDWHVRKESTSELAENKVPADTFHRWRHYEEVNYDKYRKLTEEIYLIKANMDYVIDVYDCFETIEDAKSFQKMYQDQFIHDVITVKMNAWVFLASWAENKEKVDFFNKNTEILEQILQQVEKDQKTGNDLLKKRMTTTKRANVRKYGPSHKKIESVFNKALDESDKLIDEESANALNKMDNPYLPKNWNDLPKAATLLGEESLVRDDDTSNVPKGAVEVELFTVSPDGTELKKSKIYTEAAAPETQKK